MVLDFIEFAKKRHSTYEFSKKPVSDVNLKLILEAARWSPSFWNMQPWRFIVVKAPETINLLTNLSGFGAFHNNPNVLIVLVVDRAVNEDGKYFGQVGEMVKNHKYMCISMPALNLCYEAEALGINSCLLSPPPDGANKLLGVPQGHEAVLIVGLGYEKPNYKPKQSERKSFNQIVNYERFVL